MTLSSKIRLAVVQQRPVFLNLAASLDRAEMLVGEAAANGADVIIFPETWLPGYPVWLDFAPNAALWDHPPVKALYLLLVKNSLALSGPHLQRLQRFSKKSKAIVIMGAHERLGGTLYNSMFFLPPKGDVVVHRKLMPTYTERLIWGRGDGSTLNVLQTEFGAIGGLICWEHWMPLARAFMHEQQEVLHIAQWPMVKEMNLICSRHYAFEGQCFVAAAGCVLSKKDMLDGLASLGAKAPEVLEFLQSMPGGATELYLKGGSAVIAPDGSFVVPPIAEQPEILYAEIDTAKCVEGRLYLDTSGHYARPDVFQLRVNRQPQTLRKNAETTTSKEKTDAS